MDSSRKTSQWSGEALLAIGVFYLTIFFGSYAVFGFDAARNSNQIALLNLCVEALRSNSTLPFDSSNSCSSYLSSASTSDNFQRLMWTHFVPLTSAPGTRSFSFWTVIVTLCPIILLLPLSTPLKGLKSQKAWWVGYVLASIPLTAASLFLFFRSNYWNGAYATAYILQVMVAMMSIYMACCMETSEGPSLLQVWFPVNKKNGAKGGIDPSSTPETSPPVLKGPQGKAEVTAAAATYENVDKMERGELQGRKTL